MISKTQVPSLVAVTAFFLTLTSAAGAQSASHSFAWFAELVSSETAAKTITVKAPVEPHLLRIVKTLGVGTPIVMVWAQRGGEGDAVRYVEREDRVPADLAGYVVRGRYVSADEAGKTMTFTTAAPDRVLQTLRTAAAGTPVKVTASMYGGAISIAPNERPTPRPAPKVAPAVPAGPPPANIAGVWVVETSLMGNKLKLNCRLGQDAATLSGICGAPPMLGDTELSSGVVNGNAVKFQFNITAFGPSLVFMLTGDVDEPGRAMKGMVSVSGFDAAFTARQAVRQTILLTFKRVQGFAQRLVANADKQWGKIPRRAGTIAAESLGLGRHGLRSGVEVPTRNS